MLQLLLALFFVAVGVLVEGLANLNIGEIIVLCAWPVLFTHKLLGNRPALLAGLGKITWFAGAMAAAFAYFIVPIMYYQVVWGWPGVVAGIVCAILAPLQLILFVVASAFNDGSAPYAVRFIGGLSFGLAAFLMMGAATQPSPWRFLMRKLARRA